MEEISPGVRKLVKWLNIYGFKTTDSGDGSNYKNGMECALEFPHVFMVVAPGKMVEEAHRLLTLFDFLGGNFPELAIQVIYSPQDKMATLMLMGVEDKDVFP